jgi:hypothetical protein
MVWRMKREEPSARSSQARTQAVMMPSKPTSCKVPKTQMSTVRDRQNGGGPTVPQEVAELVVATSNG